MKIKEKYNKKKKTLKKVINLNCKITWERRKKWSISKRRFKRRADVDPIVKEWKQQQQQNFNHSKIDFDFCTLLSSSSSILCCCLFVCQRILCMLLVFMSLQHHMRGKSGREREEEKIDPQWQRQQRKSYRGRVPKSVTGKFTPYETFSKMKKKKFHEANSFWIKSHDNFIYLFRLVRSNLLLNVCVCLCDGEKERCDIIKADFIDLIAIKLKWNEETDGKIEMKNERKKELKEVVDHRFVLIYHRVESSRWRCGKA